MQDLKRVRSVDNRQLLVGESGQTELLRPPSNGVLVRGRFARLQNPRTVRPEVETVGVVFRSYISFHILEEIPAGGFYALPGRRKRVPIRDVPIRDFSKIKK